MRNPRRGHTLGRSVLARADNPAEVDVDTKDIKRLMDGGHVVVPDLGGGMALPANMARTSMRGLGHQGSGKEKSAGGSAGAFFGLCL